MEFLGIFGIIIGVIAIIYFALREISIIVAAPLAAFLIIVFNQMDIVQSLLGSGSNQFMGALGNYIINFSMLFLLGSILANLMKTSGATLSIANYLLEKIGTDKPYRALLAVFIICCILTYGGISPYVVIFVVIPLSRTIFQKLDLAWNLFLIPLSLGIGTVTLTVLPGAPSMHNVIPTHFLGTSLVAAAIPGLIGAVGAVLFGCMYMKLELHKSLKRGETFSIYAKEVETVVQNTRLPSFTISIIPPCTLIIMVLLGSGFGDEFLRTNIIVIALFTAILLALWLFTPFLPNKLTPVSTGATSSLAPLFAVGSTVAFGAVIMGASGFAVFSDSILSISGSPLISLSILTGSMSAITGSASGSLAIVIPEFYQYFLDTGLHPEIIHRVAGIAANIFTNSPHSGLIITIFSLTGLNYRNGYKHVVVTAGGSLSVALIIVIGVGLLLY